MPCITPLATGRTLELGWVTELLKEVRGDKRDKPNYDDIDYRYYGADVSKLDQLTDQLCTQCRSFGEEKMATMSPQLRYWWKRHQMHDELRAFRATLNVRDLPED